MRGADVGAVLALVLGFGVLVTAHLCVVVGLLARAPWWKGIAALVVAPLAPYWAIRSRMHVRGISWLLGAAVYVVARTLAR